MKLRALFAATTVILTACGGGGGGSGVADERPEGTAKGIAQHGPIVNADISAYDWDGARGIHRGSTRTDGEGRYSLALSVPDRPLLIGSREGSYSEESTGRSVQMGNDELTAVVFYESGRSVDVQLTYFTTLATCRAEYLIGEKGLTVGNAINQANNEWSAILGVDIVGVQPVDVTQDSAFTPFMTPSHQYGVALAGVSELVNKIRLEDGADEDSSSYTVKYLTKVACSDIRHDGALNGLGAPTAGNPSGQLYVGSTALNVDWYRRALGQGVIAFGSNENNKTGLTPAQFLEMANTIALSSSAVFDGQEGTPVDNEGPIVTSTLAEGSLVNGTASLSFEVSDPLGVKTVGFYIDDNFYADAQPGNPVLNWTTNAYSDGEHTVKVVATDVLDNPTEREFTFTVANEGPSITFTSPALVNSTSYTAFGTYTAVISDVDRIVVNGVNAVVNREEGTWSANLALTGGENEVEVQIFDGLDNSNSIGAVVSVDLFAPSINSWESLAKLTNYDGLLNTCETVFLNAENSGDRPICLNAEKISLDGNPVRTSLHNDGYLILGMEFGDPQGAYGVFSDNENIRLTYQVWLNDELLVDWADVPRPDLTRSIAVLPVTKEYFGESFYQVSRNDDFRVILKATDEAGGNNELIYDFQLDVLTPAFELASGISNPDLFTVPFTSRTVLNGATVNVEYSWFNASLPYMIQVQPGEDHQLTQTYQGAQRRNFARDVGDEQWQVRVCDYYFKMSTTMARTCASGDGGWSDYQIASSLRWYNDGRFETIRPESRVSVSAYREVASDTVTPKQPSGWSNKAGDYGRRYGLNCTWSSCFEEDLFNPDNRPARVSWGDDDGDTRHRTYFQSRVVYDVEYQSGYPKNEFSDHTTDYPYNASTVRVYNVSAATEIQPQNGWYAIPSNSEIRIVKEVALPYIANHIDRRVSQNADSVPYGYEIYEDSALSYGIDTDITITRAINPGSVDEVENVSQTISTHGNEIVNFNLNRS